jgi:hypothetical protein
MNFRFVGNAPSVIGERVYDRFGSMAQFTETLARDVLAGGGSFLPESDYAQFHFTWDEEQKAFHPWETPSESFLERKAKAQARVRQLMADPASITDLFSDKEAQ